MKRIKERIKHFVHVIRASGTANPLYYNCTNRKLRKLIKIFVTPAGLIRWLIGTRPQERTGIAAVLIAKNEAPYIKEWLDFHIKQGINHFFIYDNDSNDNFREVLKPYIDSGIVTYQLLPGRGRLLDAYNMAAATHGKEYKYFAVIDADEFLFVRKSIENRNLFDFVDEFMTSHKNAGGLAVHWLIFGSAGHIKKPEGGVLENYTKCAERNYVGNHVIKTICDPMKVLGYITPHFPVYVRGYDNLDENGEHVHANQADNVCFEKIRINHYTVKARDEFIRVKMSRGDVASLKPISMDVFVMNDRNEETDTEILSVR